MKRIPVQPPPVKKGEGPVGGANNGDKGPQTSTWTPRNSGLVSESKGKDRRPPVSTGPPNNNYIKRCNYCHKLGHLARIVELELSNSQRVEVALIISSAR